MNYGERIKELRTKHDFTQKELAKKMGILPQSLIKYEKNKSSFTLKFREKLLKAFTKNEVEYIEYGGTEKQLAALFGDIGKKSNVIGNTSNSSNITQNSHNGGEDSGLSAEEKTLIKYFRKRDEETQEKIMAYALTGKCD